MVSTQTSDQLCRLSYSFPRTSLNILLLTHIVAAFQVAVALAEAQNQTDDKGLILIKPEHIKASVHMSAEFKDYLEKLHKQTQTKRAALLGYRFDAYGSSDSQPEKI